MKKKVLLLTLSSFMTLGLTAVALSAINKNNSYSKEIAADSTFDLDVGSATEDTTNHVINTTATNEKGYSIDMEIGGNVSLSGSDIIINGNGYGYITNLDPIRGIDEFSIRINGVNILRADIMTFASSQPISTADIDAAMIPDLTIIHGNGGSVDDYYEYTFDSTTSPELINARYVFSLIYSGANEDIQILGSTYHTPCDTEPAVTPKAKTTDWKASEKAGLLSGLKFNPPFVATNAYELFDNSPMGVGCDALFFSGMAYSSALDSMIDGYTMTSQQMISEYEMNAIFQKKVEDDVYSLVFMLNMMPSNGFYVVECMFSDVIPYAEQATSWPTSFLADCPHNDLIIPFTTFDDGTNTYTTVAIYGMYGVSLDIVDPTVSEDDIVEAMDNIASAYLTSGFELDYKSQQSYQLISYDGLGLSISYSYNISSKTMSFAFTPYNVYDHFPVEFIEGQFGVTYPSYTYSGAKFIACLQAMYSNPQIDIRSNNMTFDYYDDYSDRLVAEGLTITSGYIADGMYQNLTNDNPFKPMHITQTINLKERYKATVYATSSDYYHKEDDRVVAVGEVAASIAMGGDPLLQEDYYPSEAGGDYYYQTYTGPTNGYAHLYIGGVGQAYIDDYIANVLPDNAYLNMFDAYKVTDFDGTETTDRYLIVRFEVLDGGVLFAYKEIYKAQLLNLKPAAQINSQINSFITNMVNNYGTNYNGLKVLIPESLLDDELRFTNLTSDVFGKYARYEVYGSEEYLADFINKMKAEAASNTRYTYNNLNDLYFDIVTHMTFILEKDKTNPNHLYVLFSDRSYDEQYSYSEAPNVSKLANFPAYTGSEKYFSEVSNGEGSTVYQSYTLKVSNNIDLKAYKQLFLDDGYERYPMSVDTYYKQLENGAYRYVAFIDYGYSYHQVEFYETKSGFVASNSFADLVDDIEDANIKLMLANCNNLYDYLARYDVYGIMRNDTDELELFIYPDYDMDDIYDAFEADGLDEDQLYQIDDETYVRVEIGGHNYMPNIEFEVIRYDWAAYDDLGDNYFNGLYYRHHSSFISIGDFDDTNEYYYLMDHSDYILNILCTKDFDYENFGDLLEENGYNMDYEEAHEPGNYYVQYSNAYYQVSIDESQYFYNVRYSPIGDKPSLSFDVKHIDKAFGFTLMHDILGDYILEEVGMIYADIGATEKDILIELDHNDAFEDYMKQQLGAGNYQFDGDYYYFERVINGNNVYVEFLNTRLRLASNPVA